MTGYFYTFDLGDIYGPRFERLAELAGFKDREEYGAMMFVHFIEQLEEHERDENAQLRQTLQQSTFFELGLLPCPEFWPERKELPF